MWHRHHLHLLKRLDKRGWSDEDLRYAQKVMFDSHSKKSKRHIFLDHVMLWGTFAAIVATNLIAMFAMTPLLVVFPNPGIYAILLLLGIVFGFLYQIVLDDIQHLFLDHHHLLLVILVPYLAVVGGFIIFNHASAVLPNLWFVNHKPWIMAIFYTIAFMAPYAISHKLKK